MQHKFAKLHTKLILIDKVLILHQNSWCIATDFSNESVSLLIRFSTRWIDSGLEI